MADAPSLARVSVARRYENMGFSVRRRGQIQLPHTYLLCHDLVSKTHPPSVASTTVNPVHLRSFSLSLSARALRFFRLLRDQLLAGDFATNVKLLQVRGSSFVCASLCIICALRMQQRDVHARR